MLFTLQFLSKILSKPNDFMYWTFDSYPFIKLLKCGRRFCLVGGLVGICYEFKSISQAVMYENEELLRELLEANPGKLYYRDKHGRSALHVAAQNGNISILDLLIEAGGFVQLLLK